MSQGLSARLCSLNALNAVFEGKKPLDQALDTQAGKHGLSSQDRGFAHALCGFVLRYKPSLQAAVNEAANRQTDITPESLNTLLLMGAAQIYLMHVPDHAAVDTAVDLAAMIKCDRQKGMVNAVLRRLIREKDQRQERIIPSLPQWLVKSWEDDYGTETAKAIEAASLKEAEIGVSSKDGSWRLTHSMPDLSPDEWVQDFSSNYPVSLLDDLSGLQVFDLCAAPGGKTMQLAAKGAHVTAVDLSEKRLNRLRDNLLRTGLGGQVDVVCADLLKWEPTTRADIVLLDAPCSATGTIRRHPDLPYIKNQKDIDDLCALQGRLLSRAAQWVKRGGQLIYCTCSVQQSEGEGQIATFLKTHPSFIRSTPAKAEKRFVTKDGNIRLLPHYGAMDGFFIAYLTKQSD